MIAGEYLNRSWLFRRLRCNPHGQLFELYAARLVKDGLARQGAWRCLNLVDGLLHWLTANRLELTNLDERVLERYLMHQTRKQSIQSGDRAALKRLLSVLRQANLIPLAPLPPTMQEEQIFEKFADSGFYHSMKHSDNSCRFGLIACDQSEFIPELLIMKTLAVVGSHHFSDYERLMRILQPWLPAHIVSSGARGADALADKLAHEYDLPIMVIKPDWKQYSRAAGPLRNRTIVDTADMIIAFWDGKSRGTASTLSYARSNGKTNIVESVSAGWYWPRTLQPTTPEIWMPRTYSRNAT